MKNGEEKENICHSFRFLEITRSGFDGQTWTEIESIFIVLYVKYGIEMLFIIINLIMNKKELDTLHT